MNDEAFEGRLGVIERDVATVRETMRTEITLVRKDFESVIEKHTTVLEGVAYEIRSALQHQKEAIPIGLVMKLFTFFAVLMVSVISAVLGIKWLALDILK